jgi:hypothetical protein
MEINFRLKKVIKELMLPFTFPVILTKKVLRNLSLIGHEVIAKLTQIEKQTERKTNR